METCYNDLHTGCFGRWGKDVISTSPAIKQLLLNWWPFVHTGSDREMTHQPAAPVLFQSLSCMQKSLLSVFRSPQWLWNLNLCCTSSQTVIETSPCNLCPSKTGLCKYANTKLFLTQLREIRPWWCFSRERENGVKNEGITLLFFLSLFSFPSCFLLIPSRTTWHIKSVYCSNSLGCLNVFVVI